MKALVGRIRDVKGLSAVILVVISCCLSVSGCLSLEQGSEAGTDVVSDPDNAPPPFTPPERTVCDPFNVGATARDRGLVGNLVYLTDDLPRYIRAVDYIANGTPIESTLYFDKLFVPTRAFDLGFYTQEGRLVVNQNDQPIYEYFGLRLETQLTLGDAEPEGWYQMAVLSDDGARLSLKGDDGVLDTIVDNDGTHSTRMGCSTRAIYMDHETKLPAVIEYYQGPRFHISLAVMWRPMPDGADPNAATIDAQCGRQGNSMYWDSTQIPSAAKPTYYEMLERGWKPLDNENYYFPEQASNPCATEDPLLVTSFAITATTRTSVTVSWVTSLPATTRAEVKNVTTGQIISSTENTLLTTSHTATITGLTANTLYAVKGISVSEGGQTATSSESAFRTPR